MGAIAAPPFDQNQSSSIGSDRAFFLALGQRNNEAYTSGYERRIVGTN